MCRYDLPSDDEDENMLWQGAIEESLRGDTLILLTSEGKRFIVSKAILVRESTFFRDLFSLPAIVELDEDGNAIPPDPIDIHISKDSIALLYNAMTHPLPKYKYLQGFRSVAAHIYALPLKDQVDLFAVADRFDCDRVQGDIMALIKYAAVTSPLDLLKRSSDANVVWPARLAIAELDNTPEWTPCRFGYKLSADEWWAAIDNLRATWQIALTKLFWEGAFELLERPGKPRRRRLNGKAYPRPREGIMQQSKRDYGDIAKEFNPE